MNIHSPSLKQPKKNLNENYNTTPQNDYSNKINYKVSSSYDMKSIPSIIKISNSPSDNKILLSKGKRSLNSSSLNESFFVENVL